eukprot:gene3674-6488_t
MIIPRNEKDLTLEWIKLALPQFNEIKEVKITPPNTQGGMSSVYVVNMTYKQPLDEKKLHPESIIIKFLGELQSMFDMTYGGHYKREIDWYKFYQSNSIPQLFYSDFLEGDFVMIMENGFLRNEGRVIDQSKGSISMKQFYLALDEIIDLHGTYWHEFSEKEGLGVRIGNNDDFMKSVNLEWIPSVFAFNYHSAFGKRNFKTVCDTEEKKKNWAKYNEENVKEFINAQMIAWNQLIDVVLGLNFEGTKFEKSNIKQFITDLKDMDFSKLLHQYIVDQSEKYPKTIVHGDFRTDNMIFDKDDNICLIDWNCITVGCGLLDVVRNSVHSLTSDVLAEKQDEILKVYQTKMSTKTGKKISLESVEEMFKSCLIHELIMCTYLGSYMYSIKDKVQLEKLGKTFDLLIGIVERAVYAVHRNYVK